MLTASEEWIRYQEQSLDTFVQQLADYYVNNPDPDLGELLEEITSIAAFNRHNTESERLYALKRLAKQEAEDTLRTWAKQRTQANLLEGSSPCCGGCGSKAG